MLHIHYWEKNIVKMLKHLTNIRMISVLILGTFGPSSCTNAEMYCELLISICLLSLDFKLSGLPKDFRFELIDSDCFYAKQVFRVYSSSPCTCYKLIYGSHVFAAIINSHVLSFCLFPAPGITYHSTCIHSCSDDIWYLMVSASGL